MKAITLTFFLLLSGLLSAQVQSSIVQLGQDININATDHSFYQLEHGHLDGDFSKVVLKKPVQIKDNKLTIAFSKKEICYTTNAIDVSNSAAFSFDMSFSGKGTLDDITGGPLRDWIDIYYILDGEKTKLGEGEHTMEGHPKSAIQQDWVQLEGKQQLELKVCMLMTGYDESYTLHQIQLHDQPIPESVKEASVNHPAEIKNTGTTTDISGVNLIVYPNPTTDWLEISNSVLFDLTKVEITNGLGQLIRRSSTYPIDVKEMPVGSYYLRVPLKEEGTYLVKPFVVAR